MIYQKVSTGELPKNLILHKEVKSLNLKRSLALAISVLMILTMPFAFGAGETLDRIKGANKWETAVEISKKGWETADAVVLASGDKFPDALAGVPLAYSLKAPVLLTKADALVEETKAEITRLGATKVYILGGTAAISAGVEATLKGMNLAVTRVQGAEGTGRAGTAASIANLVAPTGSKTVVLAYAWNFPDALAAASYAAVNGYPILLSNKDDVPQVTLDAIEKLGATKILVIGGDKVITDAALKGLTFERIKGANREATSVELAKKFAADANMFYIATGDGFADAIAGAALAAKEGTGILLVRASLHDSVAQFLNTNVSEAVIFGGTKAVSDTVAAAVKAKLVVPDTGIAGFVSGSLKGVVVTAGGKSATSDEEGFYFIPGVLPGKHVVTAKLDAYEVVEVKDVVVTNEKVSVLNIDLGTKLDEDKVDITGIVYNSSTMAPIENATVLVEKWNKDTSKWGEVKKVVTDSNGQWTSLAGFLKFATEYRITISKDVVDYNDAAFQQAQFMFTTGANVEANPLASASGLRPIAGSVISGTIYDKAGKKLDTDTNTVDVALMLDGEVLKSATSKSKEGAFKFAELTLPTGTYTLKTVVDAHAVYTQNIKVTEGQDLTSDIRLQGGQKITFNLGISPLAPGTMFTNGTYDAVLKQGDTVVQETTASATAAEYITFTFGDVTATQNLIPDGSYTLVVSGDHIVTTPFTVKVNKDSTQFSGRAALAGKLTGKVVLGAGGSGDVTKVLVELLDEKGNVVAKTNEDNLVASDGTFAFVGVPAGKYTFRASLDKYVTDATKTAAAVILKDSVELGTLTIEPVSTKGGVKGYLMTAGTNYYANGAKVTIYEWDKDNKVWNQVGTTYTVGVNGFYEFANLDEGDYLMVIRHAGVHENLVVDIEIVADKTPAKNFFLQTGGANTFAPAFVNADGEKVVYPDTQVITLTDEWGDISYTAAFNALPITNLPVGTYTLEIAAATIETVGYVAVEMEIEIKSGANKPEITVIREADSYAVDFYIYSGFSAPVKDAKVIAISGDKVVATDTSTSVGYVEFASLPEGDYIFKVYADGFYLYDFELKVEKAVTAGTILLTPWKK